MSLLKVSGLGKSFGGVKAVDGIHFELAAGELLALIGPNGAGKSTTFNMVNGQLPADAGSIQLDGQELVGRKPRDIWRMGVGRTFQIAETFASLTVVENVQMALISNDNRLFAMWRKAADHKRDEALALLEGPAADVLLVDLGLPDGSGIDVIRTAQAAWPSCAVMVTTAFGDEAHVIASIEAGASGYLLKDGPPQYVVQEIRTLRQGGSPISPLIARRVLQRLRVALPTTLAEHHEDDQQDRQQEDEQAGRGAAVRHGEVLQCRWS